MNYYLKTTTTFFIDPHGIPDEGGIEKEVVSIGRKINIGLLYGEMDLNPEEESYDSEIEEHEREFEEEYGCKLEDWEPESASDGYNSETYTYEYRELTADEYWEYEEIIRKYDNL